MNADLGLVAVLWGFALTGFVGSLHCVGMCGPILLSFSRLLRGEGGWISFCGYQVGRLWTYALLGALAGWMGQGWRAGAAFLGWQRPLAVVLAGGLILLGMWSLKGRATSQWLSGCASGFASRAPGLREVWMDPRAGARLLVGAVMGFLPCGLVYGALVMAAVLADPLPGALGMLAFGSGTIPALAMVVWGARWIPLGLRRWAGSLHAYVLLSIGAFMLLRTLLVGPGGHMH